MRKQDEKKDKDDASRRRAVSEDEDDATDDEPAVARTDPLANLREGYSWIQHFQNEHPGWEFLSFENIPWTPLTKSVSECKVGYVGFAGAYNAGQKPFNVAPSAASEQLRRQRFKTRGDWSCREIPRDAQSSEVHVAHAHYDHSDADEDINCVFPMDRLVELEFENVVASINETHFSLMSYVPEWPLIESGVARQIGDKLQKAQVDLVFLSPGCVLGHQNMAMLQRYLEERGFSTLSLTLCVDITEHVGVPRAVSLRFPLGNPFGAALDNMTQFRILRDAFAGFEEIQEPGTILELPYEWVRE